MWYTETERYKEIYFKCWLRDPSFNDLHLLLVFYNMFMYMELRVFSWGNTLVSTDQNMNDEWLDKWWINN